MVDQMHERAFNVLNSFYIVHGLGAYSWASFSVGVGRESGQMAPDFLTRPLLFGCATTLLGCA